MQENKSAEGRLTVHSNLHHLKCLLLNLTFREKAPGFFTLLSKRTFKTITIVNYYTDYYNSPLIQFFKSGHISRCQSTAYKSYNKCDRLATVANCVLTHTHQSFKKWLLMGGPKKGIHHFLKWPPFATMPGGLYCLQGFVRIAGQFIKCILVLLFYDFFFFLLHTSENLSYQISYQRDFYL